jgi:immune inhibitor A
MKIRSGFVTPTVISSDGTYTANDINSSSHNIFKIQSGTSGEYFLLQNRNAVGYDQGLNMLDSSGTYAGGLLITHNSDNVSQNTNDSHRVVDIEEADNAGPLAGGHSRGTYNGLFYNGNSTTFNDSSTPNSKRVSGAASNIAITNIGNRGTAISFTVDVP